MWVLSRVPWFVQMTFLVEDIRFFAVFVFISLIYCVNLWRSSIFWTFLSAEINRYPGKRRGQAEKETWRSDKKGYSFESEREVAQQEIHGHARGGSCTQERKQEIQKWCCCHGDRNYRETGLPSKTQSTKCSGFCFFLSLTFILLNFQHYILFVCYSRRI